MNRNPKDKNGFNLFLNNYFNIILVVFVILFLVLAYYVVIKPKYDMTMAAIKINIESQERLYAEQQKKLSNLKTIAELYKKISPSDLKKFNGVLPDAYVKERLFGEFDEIISQNGFILNSINISKEEPRAAEDGSTQPSSNVGRLSLQLSISAIDYAGFKNLLRLLESNLRLFDITNLNFAPGANTANLTLTTYYYNK